jgi:acyl carrier protein
MAASGDGGTYYRFSYVLAATLLNPRSPAPSHLLQPLILPRGGDQAACPCSHVPRGKNQARLTVEYDVRNTTDRAGQYAPATCRSFHTYVWKTFCEAWHEHRVDRPKKTGHPRWRRRRIEFNKRCCPDLRHRGVIGSRRELRTGEAGVSAMTNLQLRVQEYIASRARLSRDQISPETLLITSGLIDSFLVVDIVRFLEDISGVRIPDDDITPDHLDSLTLMQNLVDRLVGSSRPAARQ